MLEDAVDDNLLQMVIEPGNPEEVAGALSGRVLLPQGLKQLAAAVSSFRDRDWERGSLASMLTAVLAAAWKHMKSEIEHDLSLRSVFLNLLTELCSRSVPEAIHLRERVSQLIALG